MTPLRVQRKPLRTGHQVTHSSPWPRTHTHRRTPTLPLPFPSTQTEPRIPAWAHHSRVETAGRNGDFYATRCSACPDMYNSVIRTLYHTTNSVTLPPPNPPLHLSMHSISGSVRFHPVPPTHLCSGEEWWHPLRSTSHPAKYTPRVTGWIQFQQEGQDKVFSTQLHKCSSVLDSDHRLKWSITNLSTLYNLFLEKLCTDWDQYCKAQNLIPDQHYKHHRDYCF